MTRSTYRLEPLVRLSERGSRIARRRLAAASRDVTACRGIVDRNDARTARAVERAREAARTSTVDAPSIRTVAAGRATALVDEAHTARESAERARQRLERAAVKYCHALTEARQAERDASLQRSVRERALVLVHLRARRQAERRESERALETWAASRRVAVEDQDAN